MSPNAIGKHGLAVAFGAVAVLAWAPLGWWPLALLAYGGLFLLITTTSRTLSTAALGLSFGLGLHICGHGWVYTTMLGPVAMDGLSALLASALLWTGLAMFTVLPGTLYAELIRNRLGRPAVPWMQISTFASLMTVGEMARALVIDRFSSLSLGYALIDTWMVGWAPVLGTYGLSWMAYGMAAALLCFRSTRQTTSHRLHMGLAVVACVVSGLLLQKVQWTEPLDTPLHFRLVQPNTRQGNKFDPAFKERITRQVQDLLTAEPADLVLAPETTFPMYWNELPEGTLAALQDFATLSGSNLLFGIATVGSQSEGHNSMVQLQPNARAVNRYDKIHLFPFGEYAPPGLSRLTRNLAIPMQDLSGGAALQAPFLLAKQQPILIGTLICHENMLADEARRWAPQAHVLINPGNLAWFDGSMAIDRGLQATRMRALEVGRPILRASNTGNTALVLASGAVAQTLPLGQAGSLSGTVTGRTGLTPYALWGDWPVWGLCLSSLFAVLVAARFSRPRWLQSREKAPRCSQTG